MNKTFIPAFYPVENYAGGYLRALERQWFKDMSGIRVGPARVRQVRMKESKIKIRFPFKHLSFNCLRICVLIRKLNIIMIEYKANYIINAFNIYS